MAEGNQRKECYISYLESNLQSYFSYMPIMKKAYDEFSIMVESGDTVEIFINEFIDIEDAQDISIIVKGFKRISEILGNS